MVSRSHFYFRDFSDDDRLTEPVRIGTGFIQGEKLPGGVNVFRGIPFAQPPVGVLRWRAPQPARDWDGVRTCLSFGPASVQIHAPRISFAAMGLTSEDCLYLNVWAPDDFGAEKKPVMVWLHGGGFLAGAGSDDFYDGQDLARKGAVVVTCNYRLGPFGFFAHPLLSAESPHNASGNYGLLDQIAALQWVRDNIAAFGGDPGRITLFGESAGGRSTALLMVCPQAKSLFHRAVMQSSTVYRPIQHLRESWYSRPSMESIGERIAEALRCNTAADPIAALRSMSPDGILAAADPALPGFVPSFGRGIPYEPIVDGWLIPDDPSDLFEAGRQHRVPVIGGANADEGTLFIQDLPLNDPERIRRLIRMAFPESGDNVLRHYPFSSHEEAYAALNNLSGDANSRAPMRSMLRSMDSAGMPAWQYHFAHVRSDFFGRRFGAYHGSEIRFVFNNLDRGHTRVVAADRQVADLMSAYWVNFAVSGDPNGAGLPQWPAYARDEESYIEISERACVKQGLRKEACDLFGSIEKERRLHRKSA